MVREIYNQMIEPKVVVACGICACSGGIFHDCYNVIGGVDQAIPVDVYAPGLRRSPRGHHRRGRARARRPGREVAKALRKRRRRGRRAYANGPATKSSFRSHRGHPAVAAARKEAACALRADARVNTEEGIDLVYSFMKDGGLLQNRVVKA